MTRTLLAIAFALAAPILTGMSVQAQPTAQPAAQLGAALFAQRGCFECHGRVGQGSIFSGPALAPNPIGEGAFRKEVRTPRSQMPAYSPAILTDAELGDIYAYLKSIPVGSGPDKIPLLAASQPGPSPGAGDAARGQVVYAANCATCHGASLDGATAAALRGEGSKRGAQYVADLIKTPPAGMPRLYPSTLSQDDVLAVAAFIRQPR